MRPATSRLFGRVAGPHPVVRDDALVVGVALVMLLVPFRADFVEVLFLIRQHHLVHGLDRIVFVRRGWRISNSGRS